MDLLSSGELLEGIFAPLSLNYLVPLSTQQSSSDGADGLVVVNNHLRGAAPAQL
jgi:hypothetical protein